MNDNSNQWMQKLTPYKGRIIATALALLTGILLLTIGFWHTLLLAIVVAIGYFIGSEKDGVLTQIVAKGENLFLRR